MRSPATTHAERRRGAVSPVSAPRARSAGVGTDSEAAEAVMGDLLWIEDRSIAHLSAIWVTRYREYLILSVS
ncbi:hypothetical protein Kosp01_06920 [Kocuria sp. NBRC 114282]|nr:hypothetical protein Kosp01_06920 [Kocuria sp. NBRC 114282]